MKHIKRDAMPILAKVSMELNNGNVEQSFKDIKLLDELLGIMKLKSIINHSKGRKTNKEKRFDDIFRARILEAIN